MTRLCERPGCSSPAAVAYGFDSEHLTVWLDHLSAPGASRAGALCRRHADAMVVPLQWTLDDRRELAPQLFAPRRRRATEPADAAVEDVRAGGPVHASDRRGRRRRPRASDDDTGQLAFDALSDAAALPVSAEVVVSVAEVDGPASPDVGDQVAVDAAVGLTPEAGVDIEPPLDPTSPLDRPATPWQPVYDQRDDLDGLLAARGSLLSRAFRGTPRPGT